VPDESPPPPESLFANSLRNRVITLRFWNRRPTPGSSFWSRCLKDLPLRSWHTVSGRRGARAERRAGGQARPGRGLRWIRASDSGPSLVHAARCSFGPHPEGSESQVGGPMGFEAFFRGAPLEGLGAMCLVTGNRQEAEEITRMRSCGSGSDGTECPSSRIRPASCSRRR
jgi:hypothetical protein